MRMKSRDSADGQWPWKGAQHHWLLEKSKSKLQSSITSSWSEWPLLRSLHEMRGGFSLWVRKIPWRRECNPLWYSCLENPGDRGTWRATVHRVAKNQAWLSTHYSWEGRNHLVLSAVAPMPGTRREVKAELRTTFWVWVPALQPPILETLDKCFISVFQFSHLQNRHSSNGSHLKWSLWKLSYYLWGS